MASITLTTTQNVTIDYTLAGFSQRFLAFLLDWLIILAWVLVHWMIAKIIFTESSIEDIYLWVVIVLFFSFYTLIMEHFMNGQTPGKRLMGIRVVMLNGKEPAFIDYFIRWSLRFVEIYLSSGVLAGIMISTTDKKQRIADIIAGTVMIKVQNIQSILASDLINLNAQNNYQASYPGVIIFTEAEMLVLKKLIDRFYAYRNNAHTKLIQETAFQISRKLDIQIKEDKPDMFLKTLIRDYVVLTR